MAKNIERCCSSHYMIIIVSFTINTVSLPVSLLAYCISTVDSTYTWRILGRTEGLFWKTKGGNNLTSLFAAPIFIIIIIIGFLVNVQVYFESLIPIPGTSWVELSARFWKTKGGNNLTSLFTAPILWVILSFSLRAVIFQGSRLSKAFSFALAVCGTPSGYSVIL